MKPSTIKELKSILSNVYVRKTAHPDYQEKWNKENVMIGQCVPTTLLVQYYFGGEIYKQTNENHYFNIIDGQVVDLTKEQFDYELDYSNSQQKQPDLTKAQTLERFELLKSRVEKYLSNK